MNKGKVRIYELSKELNLENRDIITIAERLNIAVKSHSSTITEEDASRIRASAQQGRSSGGVKPRPVPNSKNGARPPAPRKQQILEIRRHKSSAPAKPNPPAAEQPSELGSAPTSDTETDTDSLVRPAPRPEAKTPEAARPAKPVSPPRPPARPAADSESEAAPEQPAEPATQSQPAAPPEPKPELVGPPPRPAKKTPAQEDADDESVMSPAVKPVLKRSDAPRPAADGEPPRRTIPIREVDDEEDVTSPRLKPKPKLKRPQATPAGRSEPESESSDSSDEPSSIGDIDDGVHLRRPTPPRQRRKTRDDDDDQEEFKGKASKANKNKRKAQPQLEAEEEDLEEITDQISADGTSSTASSNLSLSLARPPKPKSKQASSKPSTPTVRSHKPSRDGGSSRRDRRDRRDRNTEPERPEFLTLREGLTVHELADQIKVPETEIIKSLFFKGIAANINQTLDIDTAKMVAEEFEVLVETAEVESEAKKVTEMLDAADLENLHRRPPVVTIMGHVDHGKTTLLDSIRKTKVAQGEAGGITQHIGAYHVDIEHEGQQQQIVFLDTPGHEAFTAMRARGTRVTDIAILVVAADDGVRPQTIEAISHAKAAQVPLIVAINKIDKETAQPDRVKQELMEHGLVPEEWGGDTIMVPVSALGGENLDTMLEMIALVAEVEDLQANPDRPARGTIIEANLDKARGPVATLLVQNGTLKVGDSLVAGSVFGKVRAMIGDRGNRVEAATPSFAVEVLGLNDVPAAGDEFEVYPDEKEARSIADSRASEQRQSRLQQAMSSRRVSLNSLSAQAQEGELKELNLLLKADVQGSLEAILGALQQLPQDEVQVRVLLAAPGEISETDVDLAAASGAVIVGFNTTLAPGARQAADRLGVDVRDYDIIYNLLEDIQGAMEGLLEPELVEEPLGQVEVRAVFPVRKGTVAGSYVLSGKVTRNCNLRVVRGGEVVYTGKLDSLKRMKDDVKEVAAGFECGIGIDNFNGWEEGDIIDAFKLVTKRRTLAMA
ncbi:translation initiation factor IF-2 [filamentous cyanobacterium CCP5]|nr:translation initiation factor IF-2 [filamentous cyanobacterium CCP5]